MGARPLNRFEERMYYFYVLRNRNNASDYYTGYTSDLKRRLAEHNSDQQASTRGRRWELAYYEAYQSERVAREREQKIKNNGRMRTLLMNRIKSQYEIR